MKRIDLYFAVAKIPLDFITLLAAATAAYSVRFSPFFASIRPITFNLTYTEYLNVVSPAIVLALAVFTLAGLYRIETTRIATEISHVFLATAAAMAVILAFAFFQRELFDSRFIVLAAWIFATIFLVIERTLVRLLQRSLRTLGIGMMHVVIIGKTKSSWQIERFFTRFPRFGYRVAMHVQSFNEQSEKHIRSLKKKDQVDAILVANPDITNHELHKIKAFTDQEHLRFIYSSEIAPSGTTRPILHTFAGLPVIEVPKTPLDGWGAIYKRVFDIVGASALILASLPLQILLALLVKLDSSGPIFFLQKRVGQGGKSFTYFKFRSMKKDAHKFRFDPKFIEKYGNMREGSPLFKLENDPRVTRIGKIMRKFSMDEIPEFYNVLRGKMSLVGPRPHMPEEVEKYQPHQRQVLTIKPGITGMAQISGRANLEFDEEVRLDQYYIENWTPWLDIIILAKTPLAVFEKLEEKKK